MRNNIKWKVNMWFYYWWYNDILLNIVFCINFDNNNDYDYVDEDENCYKYLYVKVFFVYILGNK